MARADGWMDGCHWHPISPPPPLIPSFMIGGHIAPAATAARGGRREIISRPGIVIVKSLYHYLSHCCSFDYVSDEFFCVVT